MSVCDKLPDLGQSLPHFLDLLFNCFPCLGPVKAIIQEEIKVPVEDADANFCIAQAMVEMSTYNMT